MSVLEWITGQAALQAVDPKTLEVREIFRPGTPSWTPTLVEVCWGCRRASL